MTNWFTTLFAPVQTPAVGDPLAHRDIARMSPKELADLPLVPPPATPVVDKARSRAVVGMQAQGCA